MLTIKLIGFTAQETDNFSAILALSESNLHNTWRIIDTDNADFFLFTEKKAGDEISFPYARCLFYATTKNNDDTQLILTDLQHLPRLRSLIDVFNHSANTLNQPNSPKQDSVFYPQGLLKHLLTITDNTMQQHSITDLPNSPVIYTDSINHLYYCAVDLEQLSPYIKAETINSQIISPQVFENCVAGLLIKPLNNLIWYLAFHGSEGRLLKNQSAQSIVCLNNWPNLAIASCRTFIKLIAFMCNNSVPLCEIAHDLEICQKDVYSFYNACYLVGLVDKKEVIYRRRKQNNQSDVLAKINNRLRESD